ncbi:MAG: DUF1385 domain-containing protein [Anaerolineales bacterium]|jgi:uncharacterized protein YqhQ|nr:DUF1385 domain-containing protein [Anaerolineales bacterium]
MEERMPTYGGQAVIEGVMMRGAQSVAIAMRAPDNQIILHTEPLTAIYRSKILKVPFVRGVIGLWDALGLGMRALTISANVQTGEDEKLEGPALYFTLGLSFALGIGLFFLAPAAVGQLSERFLGLNSWWGNLIEGLIRLGLLVGYIWAVGRVPEIQRVFAYHGAEHKTINAFEAGAELKPEIVKGYSLEHPRCGTSFLLTLVLLSVVLFSLLGPLPLGLRLLSRVLLLPVLAGISYEYIRWTAHHLESPFVRKIIRPNMALQHLTTREPSLEMLEVSIAAFDAMHKDETAVNL